MIQDAVTCGRYLKYEPVSVCILLQFRPDCLSLKEIPIQCNGFMRGDRDTLTTFHVHPQLNLQLSWYEVLKSMGKFLMVSRYHRHTAELHAGP